ncbi:MAG: hypothetical protein ACLP9K_08175 [Nitrososphaerales archaeon]|jgi:hypothetical protein
MGRQGVMRDQDQFGARSEAQYVSESQDWSNLLNESAKAGFTVKDSGALQFADNIVFWALLEKQ